MAQGVQSRGGHHTGRRVGNQARDQLREPHHTMVPHYDRVPHPHSTRVALPEVPLPEELGDSPGPLTEDSILRTLQARYREGHYWVSLPHILANHATPHRDTSPPQSSIGPFLVSLHPPGLSTPSPTLSRLTSTLTSAATATNSSQTLVVRGSSSARSGLVEEVVRCIVGEQELGRRAGAGLAVLRPLTSTLTSSATLLVDCTLVERKVARVRLSVHLIEGGVGRGATIITWLLAGLTREELEEQGLEGRGEERSRKGEEEMWFRAWRSSLAEMGICPEDVVRVLAAVVLLQEVAAEEVEDSNMALENLSRVMGVNKEGLVACLTTSRARVAGEVVRMKEGVRRAAACLGSSLYLRTVHTVVRRINRQEQVAVVGPIVSVLEVGEVEKEGRVQGLHTLATLLLQDSLQHLYNTQALGGTVGHLVEESAAVVDLLSSPECGLFPLLVRVGARTSANPDKYMGEVEKWQGHSSRLLHYPQHPLQFTVRHCGGLEVAYSATDFLSSSKGWVGSNLVSLFHPDSCTFPFLSHLYSSELREGGEVHPLGPTRGRGGGVPCVARSFHQQVHTPYHYLPHLPIKCSI